MARGGDHDVEEVVGISGVQEAVLPHGTYRPDWATELWPTRRGSKRSIDTIVGRRAGATILENICCSPASGMFILPWLIVS